MHGVELVLISLLVAVSVLAAASRAIGVPYPIVLVLGGLAMGFLPGSRTSSSSPSSEVMHRIERELDLEDERLEI